MTLLETDAALPRLNGAHAPPPPTPPETAPAPAEPCTPVVQSGAGRGLLNYAGTARRFLTDAERIALQAEARRHVEGTLLSFDAIGSRLDVQPGTVWQWAKRFGWQRPEEAPRRTVYAQPPKPEADPKKTRRAQFVERLYSVFERQTSDLEARAVDPLGRTDEKDARTLSVLAKALETLIALDRDDGASSDTPEPADRERFNADLAARIRRWAEGGTRPAGNGEESRS